VPLQGNYSEALPALYGHKNCRLSVTVKTERNKAFMSTGDALWKEEWPWQHKTQKIKTAFRRLHTILGY